MKTFLIILVSSVSTIASIYIGVMWGRLRERQLFMRAMRDIQLEWGEVYLQDRVHRRDSGSDEFYLN